MEIRRAILLFAIVLGHAALVTSFTRSTEEQGGERNSGGSEAEEADPAPPPAAERDEATPAASPGATAPTELRFPAGADRTTRTLDAGSPATLVVAVLAPGQVAVEDLGLNGSAQPGTPARFDVLTEESGRYPIDFTPANGADGRAIGVLRVRD